MPRRRPRHARQTIDLSTRRLLSAQISLYQLLQAPRPLDTLLQEVLDTALRCVPGAQRGSLMVVDNGRLRYRAARGYDLDQLRPVSFPSELVVASILGGRRAAQVSDYTEWDERHLSPADIAILRQHGAVGSIRRSLITAIIVDGRLYGTLVLDNLLSHAPFPRAAETVARLFAEQVGTVIEHALLVERLQQTNTRLIESERLAALGRFIASIAHEINNPLTAVIGYAEFLAGEDLPPPAAEMLGQLRSGATRVAQIVRNLQIFARQQKVGAILTSLNLLIEQSLMLKQGDLALDQISLRLDLDPQLPRTWADAGQISQILLNLINNAQYALHATPPPRQIALRSWLEPRAPGGWVCLSVADTGPGIPPELLDQIFTPFFTTKPIGAGTGLGLSISQAIAAEHGGHLSAANQPAGGAIFTLALPLRAAPVGARATAAAPPPAVAPPQGRRILLIDDDLAVTATIRQALQPGNKLLFAADGRTAVAILAGQPVDVILADLRMPVMDGFAFYHQLRAAQPELAERLIFISGDTSSPVAYAELAAAGRPLLAKPFTPAELYAAIAGVLDDR